MKIYFMKQSALNTLKANMNEYYPYYFQKDDNSWIEEVLGENPFIYFIDVPDFELAELDDRPAGEIDLENCKIVYEKLKELSPSQAADERLWAGLCNGVFYKYMRRRYGYTTAQLTNPEKDKGSILSRFFLKGQRSGLYRNTLAKSWWVGRATYNPNLENRFEMLDELGPNDLSTKVSDIFYSNTFASNPTIACGICNALRYFSDKDIKLNHRAHIRPAIQYLNAVGGATLLDMLSEDEIEKIMISRITELLKGISGPIQVEEVVDTDDEDNDETSAEIDTSEIIEEQETVIVPDLEDFDEQDEELTRPEYISYGCVVTVVRDSDQKELIYHIPLKSDTSREMYAIEKRMLGKTAGARMYFSGSWYEVVDFDWDA